MPLFGILRTPLVVLFVLCMAAPGKAQIFPFTSGPIPPCDTSTFTATVTGVGWLVEPGPWSFGPYLDNVLINITSNHPQTLQISLTSPAGTTLLLSAFNGAGGQNYTNTNFFVWAGNNITTGSAPFTGSFAPQGGSLNNFAGQSADGIWTITVIDTACANGGAGPGGTWTPGWFQGGAGTGAFAFGFSSPPPPCIVDMGWQTTYLCPGESVDMLAYYVSNWDNGTGVSFTIQDQNWLLVADPSNVSAPGQYTVQGWDWMSCSYYGTYEIFASPQIALGPDQVVNVCNLAPPVNLNAMFNLAGITTAWSWDNVPISNATASAAWGGGVYQLIGSNNGGCNDTALVTMNVTASAILGPDQTINLCPGDVVDLTTLYVTAGYTTSWDLGGAVFTTPTAATDAGVYMLTATTNNGCTATAEVTIIEDVPQALGADQNHDLCSNATMDLTGLYATAGLMSTWTLAGAPVATPGSISAAGTYRLIAANGTGCADTAFVTVNALAAPALGANAIAAVCSGNTVDLSSQYNTAGLTSVWTFAGAAVSAPTAVGVAGQYTLIATNVDGCADTASVNVVVSANPVLGADQSLIECDGVSVDLTTLYATGANTIAWTVNGSPVADATAVTSGGVYTLTATNASNCSATANVTLVLNPSPALGADLAASICVGSTFDLSSLYATAGLAAAWTLGGVAVTDPTAVDISGNYQLVATNGSGCSDVAMVAFTVDPAPNLGVDLSFTLCPWQTVDLSTVFPTAGMSATYLLDGAAVVDPTAVSDTGVYVITVIDVNGCTDEAMATVAAMDCLCEADFRHNARCIQEPVEFTLLADSVVVSAQWDYHGAANSTTDIDPMVRFSAEGEVLVTLQATLTCGVVLVERTIRMYDCTDSCTVWIPSAFTPNNDTRNDTWSWDGECEPKDFSAAVFDRWGEAVFTTKDHTAKWDGTYGGELLPSGVYVYRVGYTLPYQKHKEVMGSVTLVR